MKELLTPAFRRAVADYYELLERGYPERRTRHLVADTYGLGRTQRTVLLRGVYPGRVNERRLALLLPTDGLPFTSETQSGPVAVDYFNVVFTVMNYLLGRTVYLSTDGVLRDDGADYRRIYREREYIRAVELTAETMGALGVEQAELFVDAGFSRKTELHPTRFLQGLAEFEQRGLHPELTVAENADGLLCASCAACKATADSRIMDSEAAGILDLPRAVLQRHYRPRLPDLRSLVENL